MTVLIATVGLLLIGFFYIVGVCIVEPQVYQATEMPRVRYVLCSSLVTSATGALRQHGVISPQLACTNRPSHC